MARKWSRRWEKLSHQVRDEEPYCRLGLTGCTTVSTTADHIVPVDEAPELEFERSNLQGACTSCNRKKSHLPLDVAIARYGLAGDEDPLAHVEALDFFL